MPFLAIKPARADNNIHAGHFHELFAIFQDNMTNATSVEGLTPIDALMPRNYIRVVLVFEDATNQSAQTTGLVQSGLNVISKQIQWLSGRVFPKASAGGDPYSLEIRWDGHTTPTLIDKGTIDISYDTASANGMQPESIPETIWPVSGMIDESLHIAGAPVFAASTFRFADRGFGLCICMHHNAVDGAAFSEIIRQWGRAIAEPDLVIPSSFEGRCERLTAALADDLAETLSTSTDELFEKHPEYSRLPPAVPETFPSCTCKLFTVSLNWIDTLKSLLAKHTLTPPSTNTILSALLWTTITRVRTTSGSFSSEIQNSRLVTAVNARRHLPLAFSPPDAQYLGNAIFYGFAEFSAPALAGADESPIRSLAEICTTVLNSQYPFTINARHVAEVHELITRTGDPRALFVGWDLFNSRDLTITSWADFGLYGVDFGLGLGRPSFVRLPYMEADGVVIVLPRRRGEGETGVEVVVMLQRDHMDVLVEDEMWRTLTKG
ncbi:transferase family-domain-containing protein [Penicillium cataractarum]|uniref:Transferase family-domain-containing protein n=1 Tax=Penicillium cataractarum TaxID=2100454 RepID=A0A9W9S7Z0_9EURO|nr:transferase family-domain-containing protein [Penicillium cataractarum]KAJ5371263.1 transferase family-domain-containing protein [Penicillium cataractarum]